jgi:hypothetical protein
MDISIGNITDTVTALIAIAAFLLSVYNFYVDRRDKRTRLVVRVSQDTQTSHRGPYKVVRIDIINLSERCVTVSAVGILWRKEPFSFPNVTGWRSEPFQLDPYDGRKDIVVDEQIVASTLREKGASGRVRIKASCQDRLGRVYLSKKYTINVDEWVKEAA